MNLKYSCCQILLVICYIKAEVKNHQVGVKNHSRTIQPNWDGQYENFIVQNSDQTMNGLSESLELNHSNREHPKFGFKKLKKKTKKSNTKRGKAKLSLTKKKKTSKLKAKSKRKWWKKNVKKFVKTISDRNRDSNMSGSKENVLEDKPVDIIVHITMKE